MIHTIDTRSRLDDIGAPQAVLGDSAGVLDAAASGCAMAVVLPVARPEELA